MAPARFCVRQLTSMSISTKVTPPLAVLPDIDVPWAGAKMIVDFSTRRVMTHSRSGAQCHGVCNTWAELMSGLDGDPNVCTMPLGPCAKGKARRASANFVPVQNMCVLLCHCTSAQLAGAQTRTLFAANAIKYYFTFYYSVHYFSVHYGAYTISL